MVDEVVVARGVALGLELVFAPLGDVNEACGAEWLQVAAEFFLGYCGEGVKVVEVQDGMVDEGVDEERCDG